MSGLKSKIQSDERGIVSILVVSILVITLALIAIGFSKLADRELTQASDRELSTQAYYAAQSGLNDAIAYLSAGGVGFPGCAPPLSEPPPSAQPSQFFSPDLSAGTGAAKYSCISIDTQPTELSADVTPGKPELVKVSAASLQNLYIAWENSTKMSLKGLPGGGSLPAEDSAAAKGAVGVLRVGIYEVPNSAGTTCNTNACLAGHMRVYYLYPNAGGVGITQVPYGGGTYSEATGPGVGNNGAVEPGNCKSPAPNPVQTADSQPHYCNVELTGLDGNNNTYYLYLTAQYQELSVSIQGTGGSGPVNFIKSQATVDVTGQGSDVIQRIRAKVSLASQFVLPNDAIQSMQSLCKNFYVNIGTSANLYGAASVKENPDNACNAPSGGGNIVGGGTAGHP